jgi:hypothetical protein
MSDPSCMLHADHVKFNLPGAWTLHVLAWGVYEFMDGYKASGQLQYALNSLRFESDFLMKCVVDDSLIVAQVGVVHLAQDEGDFGLCWCTLVVTITRSLASWAAFLFRFLVH